jgi:hypothetical protein
MRPREYKTGIGKNFFVSVRANDNILIVLKKNKQPRGCFQTKVSSGIISEQTNYQ